MRRRARSGFTLVEVLASLLVLSVILAAVMRSVISTQRQYMAQRDEAGAQERLQSLEQFMGFVLRSARADARNLGIASINPDPLAHGAWDNIRVQSDFNPGDGNVTGQYEDVIFHVANDTLFMRFTPAGADNPALYPVRSLQFDYYRLDGTQVTTAADIPSARGVRVTMRVPRRAGSNALMTRQSWYYFRN